MSTKTLYRYTVAMVCTLFSVTTNATTGITTLVRVSSDGLPVNNRSGSPSVSADGRYVAFDSHPLYALSDYTAYYTEVFVHDRQTGKISRVSIDSDGAPANDHSFSPTISTDGRFVVFSSIAVSLVGQHDTNADSDVFLHDRQTGKTTRVSVASDGTQGNRESNSSGLSADGRFVVFSSYATNLVAVDTNGTSDVFVHDSHTGATTRVSVASDGSQANARSFSSGISADGRFVPFWSEASNLVAGDTNGLGDIFIHDCQTGKTIRINVATDGTQTNAHSFASDISADGRFVAFGSAASNLVVGDTNNTGDIFAHNRQTGKTTRVSVASDDALASGGSNSPSISADGRFVAFYSAPKRVKSKETKSNGGIFVHDRQTGKTTQVSVASDGTQANGPLGYPSISADGRVVAFPSHANNLATGITGNTNRVFVHERLMGPLAESQVVNIPIKPSFLLKGRNPKNDPLMFNIVTPPAHGTLNGVAPKLVYKANTGYFGVDRFTFTVTDGVETSAPAPVILRVSSNTLCSNLGNNHGTTQPDRDSYVFRGTTNENIKIQLEHNPNGVTQGNWNWAYMTLWKIKNGKLVKPSLASTQGRLPIKLNTNLREKGIYLINVIERGGYSPAFTGDYCLSLNASKNLADTLKATRSIE